MRTKTRELNKTASEENACPAWEGLKIRVCPKTPETVEKLGDRAEFFCCIHKMTMNTSVFVLPVRWAIVQASSFLYWQRSLFGLPPHCVTKIPTALDSLFAN